MSPRHHDQAVHRPPDGHSAPEHDTAVCDPAARLAATDAARVIAVQYAAGADLGQIQAYLQDVAARLLADARTAPGRAYARGYARAAATLLAQLRQDQAVAYGRSPAACAQPDGTPHPDPFLASRGWQADHGLWQRTGTRAPGQEAS